MLVGRDVHEYMSPPQSHPRRIPEAAGHRMVLITMQELSSGKPWCYRNLPRGQGNQEGKPLSPAISLQCPLLTKLSIALADKLLKGPSKFSHSGDEGYKAEGQR